MPRRKQVNFFAGLAGAFCLSLIPCAVRAQVATPTVTLNNGIYHYNYSISNTTPDDLLDVDIHVPTGDNAAFNIVTPTGFLSSPDTVMGLVGFQEDTSFFTATPLSGFAFDSVYSPNTSVEDSYYALNGLTMVSSNVLAPVPEPGSMALIGSFGVAAVCALRQARRKRSK